MGDIEDDSVRMIMDMLKEMNITPGKEKKMIKKATKFIAENGGMENFKSVYRKQKESTKEPGNSSPVVPTRDPPPVPPSKSSDATRQPPIPPINNFSAPPPPPVGLPPPPPPPIGPPPPFISSSSSSRNPPVAAPVDARSNLLDGIRGNKVVLKPVEERVVEKKIEEGNDDVVNQLFNALNNIRGHISKLIYCQ